MSITSKSYTRKIGKRYVDVEFSTNPLVPGDFGIYLSTSDGKSLSSQEILDAVSDALLVLHKDGINLLTQKDTLI